METYVEELRKTLAHGEMQERKAVLNGIIKSVTVDQENVTIQYRLPHPNEETESGVLSVLPAVSLSGA